MSDIKNELQLVSSIDNKETSISDLYQIINEKLDKILERFTGKQLKKKVS